MIRTIPLNKLVPSPRNVRRVTDEQADLQLKADIEARGLLQNLVVAPVNKPKGRFAVEAGGRRLKALKSLVDDGKLAADHEVACLVIGSGAAAAQEAGLAENFQRLAMNPADECLAFGQLVEQGADAEGIARRFGLTVRFVEGRLRLSALATVVFDALGAGEITLDIAKAYAATPDRERQAFVFEQVSRSYMGQHPDSIRRMMTQATVAASDRRARFVGEDAYVAAGGRIERDLFSDEDGARWLDIALLERLATEKLEAVAAESAAAAGLAFVRPTLDGWIGQQATIGLRRVRLETPPLSEEENAEVETLEAEMEDLARQLEHEEIGDEARAIAEARAREIGARIEALTEKQPIIPDELRPRIGTFLLLDDEGRPTLEGTYFTSEADEPESREETDAASDADPGAATTAASGSASGERETAGPGISQALVDELAMQRRDILAVHVAADPALALDLAAVLMIDRGQTYDFTRAGSSLVAAPPSDPVLGFRTPNAAATVARAEAAEALDRSWMAAGTRAERFDAFRALSEEARVAWVGHAVARTLEASLNLPGMRACPFHDHLGQLLRIDVARWWRPTGANYFDRVPKSVTLAALEAVGGPVFAAGYAKAKKAELSETAERIFAGDFIGEVAIKEAALAWVPEPMRFAPLVAPAAGEETPPWEDEPSSGSLNASRDPDAEDESQQEAPPADAEDSTPATQEPAPEPEPELQESGGCELEVDGGQPSEKVGEAA